MNELDTEREKKTNTNCECVYFIVIARVIRVLIEWQLGLLCIRQIQSEIRKSTFFIIAFDKQTLCFFLQ